MRRRADEFSGRCVGVRHSRVLTVAWIVVVGLPLGVVVWAARPYRDGGSVGKGRRGNGPNFSCKPRRKCEKTAENG